METLPRDTPIPPTPFSAVPGGGGMGALCGACAELYTQCRTFDGKRLFTVQSYIHSAGLYTQCYHSTSRGSPSPNPTHLKCLDLGPSPSTSSPSSHSLHCPLLSTFSTVQEPLLLSANRGSCAHACWVGKGSRYCNESGRRRNRSLVGPSIGGRGSRSACAPEYLWGVS